MPSVSGNLRILNFIMLICTVVEIEHPHFFWVCKVLMSRNIETLTVLLDMQERKMNSLFSGCHYPYILY